MTRRRSSSVSDVALAWATASAAVLGRRPDRLDGSPSPAVIAVPPSADVRVAIPIQLFRSHRPEAHRIFVRQVISVEGVERIADDPHGGSVAHSNSHAPPSTSEAAILTNADPIAGIGESVVPVSDHPG